MKYSKKLFRAAISFAVVACGLLSLPPESTRGWHSSVAGAEDPWVDWTNLGGPGEAPFAVGGEPSVVRNLDGRLEVFASNRTVPGVWHTRQVTPSGEEWTNWEFIMSVPFGSPSLFGPAGRRWSGSTRRSAHNRPSEKNFA